MEKFNICKKQSDSSILRKILDPESGTSFCNVCKCILGQVLQEIIWFYTYFVDYQRDHSANPGQENEGNVPKAGDPKQVHSGQEFLSDLPISFLALSLDVFIFRS